MRSPARRAVLTAAVALFAVLLLVPALAFAADPVDVVTVRATEEAASSEVSSSVEAAEPADADGAPSEQTADGTTAAEASDSSVLAADSEEAAPVAAAGQFSSQATADTRRAIENLLKGRKRQFDSVANELQRTVDQLSGIIRKLDAAGVNVSVARARLAEAKAALDRARVLERTTVARYRSVLSADNERDAYARARASARTSSAQLERARVKVLTATKTLRAIVKNVTVENVGASTDST